MVVLAARPAAHCASSRMALFGATVACSSVSVACQSISNHDRRRIPPRFGGSVRYMQTTPPIQDSMASSSKEREDCPICRKYSQGPCGEAFVKWLDCVDRNEGIDAKTQQELHLIHCRDLGDAMAKCLHQHESYYASLTLVDDDEESSDADNDESDEDLLQEAWTKVVREVESSKPKMAFPDDDSISPRAEFRPSTKTGMIAFSYECKGRPLVMAYVKDDATGSVLAAGSYSDLWQMKDRGALRLGLPPSTTSITIHALYETEKEVEEVIFTRTERVPAS
jgi:hypothetical protein